MSLYEGHPRGEAICVGLPCLLAWGSVRQCRAEGAIQGEDLLPAACAARADLNPLPESERKLSASAEHTGAGGPGSRAGQAARAREGGGRASQGRQRGLGREGLGQLGPELV